MSAEKKKDLAKMSFEESLSELEEIVRRLEEGGSNNLDKAIEDYTRGTELRKHAEKKLAEAKLKVEKIVSSANGKQTTEPFEIEE